MRRSNRHLVYTLAGAAAVCWLLTFISWCVGGFQLAWMNGDARWEIGVHNGKLHHTLTGNWPYKTLRRDIVVEPDGIPLFWLGAVLAVVPALCLKDKLVARYEDGATARTTRKAALCENCGYDLRASPDRCPECGAPHRGPLALRELPSQSGQALRPNTEPPHPPGA